MSEQSAQSANANEREQEKNIANIRKWLEINVAGEILSIERLERWRPVWRADYIVDGVKKALLLKGERPCTQLYSLKHEMLVMEILEANGIPVPHIHGWIEDPKVFVMDCVDGDRDPGLIHTAIDSASTLSPERWRASFKYMEELAKIHQIPLSDFPDIEGGHPVGADNIAMSQFNRQYQLGLEVGAVDANMAFFESWLRRNVPQHRTKSSLITGDCGQFMSSGEDITGIIDLEIAHIGDPLMDLACFRGRHPYENMGDIPELYRHYQSVNGEKLDLPVIAYHTVCFLGFAAIAAIMFMDPKKPESNWIEGMLELASISRRALEAMAELEGVELDYDISLPEPHDTPIEDMAIEKLLLEISNLPLTNEYAEWQRGLLAAIPKYLLNHAHYGRWYESETIREIGELTGIYPESLSAAETQLKELIGRDDSADDAALLKLFHRRMLRLSMVIAGANPSDENPLFFKLEPILTMNT